MISETTDALPRRRFFGRPVRYMLISLLVATGLYVWMRSRPTPAHLVKAQFMHDVNALDSTISHLQRSLVGPKSSAQVQSAFRQARLAYKRIEFISAYYSPETTRALNGPNIPEVDDDLRVNTPEGFQVLEEMLFPAFSVNDRADALQTAAVIRSNVNRLRKISESNELTDGHVFDAMRLEVFRIITLGITGFDSPMAFYSMPEAASALESLQQQLRNYDLPDRDAALSARLDNVFEESISGLRSASSFDKFDRLRFIGQQANVLSGLLMDAQETLAIPVFSERRLLSPQARTLTDAGVFDSSYFTDFDWQRATPDRVALGKMLFFDPILSSNGGQGVTRTCATCHQPDKAFTDGEHKSLAVGVGGKRIARNAPTLFNASLQAVQFYDSRVVFLEDQVSDVIQNTQEMHGSLPDAVNVLAKNPEYRALFARSYREGVTEQTLKNAVASYIRSLTSLDSRVDRYLRTSNLNETATLLTNEEKQGFNLFMGKAKCATCHFFPLFNGTVPPAYQESESEVLGVPATAADKTVDPDVGKFVLTGREPHRYAFKTPTVRNVAKTAPYMHNGVYRTLDQVVEFYTKGGGNGLGFGLSNQTLPFDELNLNTSEKKSLVAFMEAL